MATKNFTQFNLKSPLSTSDYIVGYESDGSAELKTTVDDIINAVPKTVYSTLDEDYTGEDGSAELQVVPNFGFSVPRLTWTLVKGVLILSITDTDGGDLESIDGQIRSIGAALPPSPTIYGNHTLVNYDVTNQQYQYAASTTPVVGRDTLVKNFQLFEEKVFVPVNFNVYNPSLALRAISFRFCLTNSAPGTSPTIHTGSWLSYDVMKNL